MTSQEPENADDDTISPQVLSWTNHARTEIKQNSPASLQTELLERVENLKTAVTESSAKYWGEKANDRQFGRRGVGTTLWLLESGGMEGYTREAA